MPPEPVNMMTSCLPFLRYGTGGADDRALGIERPQVLAGFCIARDELAIHPALEDQAPGTRHDAGGPVSGRPDLPGLCLFDRIPALRKLLLPHHRGGLSTGS